MDILTRLMKNHVFVHINKNPAHFKDMLNVVISHCLDCDTKTINEVFAVEIRDDYIKKLRFNLKDAPSGDYYINIIMNVVNMADWYEISNLVIMEVEQYE